MDFTLRVLAYIGGFDGNEQRYDVWCPGHSEFASGGTNAAVAVADSVRRIVEVHPACTIKIETVREFAPGLSEIQDAALAELGAGQPISEVLARCVTALRAAGYIPLAEVSQERIDLGQARELWSVKYLIDHLDQDVALLPESKTSRPTKAKSSADVR